VRFQYTALEATSSRYSGDPVPSARRSALELQAATSVFTSLGADIGTASALSGQAFS